VCVCGCIYALLCVCVYNYIRLCVCVCVCIYTLVCECVCACIYTLVCVFVFTHIYACTDGTCTSVCTSGFVRASLYVQICSICLVCRSVSVRVSTYLLVNVVLHTYLLVNVVLQCVTVLVNVVLQCVKRGTFLFRLVGGQRGVAGR